MRALKVKSLQRVYIFNKPALGEQCKQRGARPWDYSVLVLQLLLLQLQSCSCLTSVFVCSFCLYAGWPSHTFTHKPMCSPAWCCPLRFPPPSAPAPTWTTAPPTASTLRPPMNSSIRTPPHQQASWATATPPAPRPPLAPLLLPQPRPLSTPPSLLLLPRPICTTPRNTTSSPTVCSEPEMTGRWSLLV